MPQWFVILTIGCLPMNEQPPGANCVIETKVIEAAVFDLATAEGIVKDHPAAVLKGLSGTFVIARYEKRARKKEKTK